MKYLNLILLPALLLAQETAQEAEPETVEHRELTLRDVATLQLDPLEGNVYSVRTPRVTVEEVEETIVVITVPEGTTEVRVRVDAAEQPADPAGDDGA